jgi:hypothetical protein
MTIPTTIKGEEKKLWKKLLANFDPKSEIEIEMGRRYLQWFQMFKDSQIEFQKNGPIVVAPNGAPYANPNFAIMKEAEKQMKFLYVQLRKSFDEPEEDEGGEFDNL